MKKYSKDLIAVLAVVVAFLLAAFVGLAYVTGTSGFLLRNGSMIVVQEAENGKRRIVVTPGIERTSQGTVLKADLARDVVRNGKKGEGHTLRLRLTLPTVTEHDN